MQYTFNGDEITFVDFVQLCKDKDLSPRIISFQGLSRAYSKMITVYLRTRILEAEKLGGDAGQFFEYATAGAAGIIDRYLFIKCIMMIGCLVEYPRPIDLSDKVSSSSYIDVGDL